MLHIPPRVLELLENAPPVVVAPVGLGFAQDDLEVWARKTKRQVLRNLGELTPDARALVKPSSRNELENLPAGLDLKRILFLHEYDLLFSLEEWQQAMEPLLGGSATQTFLETGGWPEGLALARATRAQGASSPLVRHPLCAARLGSLLPKDIPRETLVRLAQSPLLIREVYELLGLEEALVAMLFDRGLLYAQGAGFALPRLLRLYLRGPTSAEMVDALDAALRAGGHTDAALELLAEHGLWERFLWLLVESFSSDWGEAYLRTQLSLVPPKYCSLPTYRYLNTFLARFAGDIGQMSRELEAILPLADNRLKPYVLNAYGVSWGMRGDLMLARDFFEQSLENLSPGSKLYATILHNFGVAHFIMGNLELARKVLLESASIFRMLGHFEEEASELATLSPVLNRLGQPTESVAYLDKALSILSRSSAEMYLAFSNLAKSKIMLGDFDGAEVDIEPLPDRKSKLRAYLFLC